LTPTILYAIGQQTVGLGLIVSRSAVSVASGNTCCCGPRGM